MCDHLAAYPLPNPFRSESQRTQDVGGFHRPFAQRAQLRPETVVAVMSQVPAVMDTIEVLFTIDGGRMEWWKAAVTDVVAFGERAQNLGRGRIVYEAKHGHAKSTHAVRFLRGYRLEQNNEPGSDTSWRNQEPAGENDVRDYEPTCDSIARPGKRCKRGGQIVSLSARDYGTDIDRLWEEINRLKRTVAQGLKCDHNELISQQVGAKRMVMRRCVLHSVLSLTRA